MSQFYFEKNYTEFVPFFSPYFFFPPKLIFQLRKYSKALEILVVNISDFSRAETYCSKYKEEDSDLMLSLLKVYLSQKIPGKILSDVTVTFLNKHASELSLENVKKNFGGKINFPGIGGSSQGSSHKYVARIFVQVIEISPTYFA